MDCLILDFLNIELTRATYPGVLEHGFLHSGIPYPRVYDPVVLYPGVPYPGVSNP